MAAKYPQWFSTRDVTTLSNLVALPSVVYMASSGKWHLALAMLLACVLSILFHSTEADSVYVVGLEVRHGLDDGLLIPALVPATWLAFGKQHSHTLLRLDEIGALLVIVATVAACGGPAKFIRAARGPFLWHIVVGLTSLAASDLLLEGWAHAITHAIWHTIAFALPPMMVHEAAAHLPRSLLLKENYYHFKAI